MVLELLVLATLTTWTPTMVTLPTDKLHVCRHVSASALEKIGRFKILTRACRPLLFRLGDGSKDYTMSLHHPRACSAIN